jgi:hypothetical protein
VDGAPSGATWPRYDRATEPFLIIDDEPALGQKFRDAECDVWDSAE